VDVPHQAVVGASDVAVAPEALEVGAPVDVAAAAGLEQAVDGAPAHLGGERDDDPRVEIDEWDSTSLDPDDATKLNAEIDAIFQTRTTEEWCTAFEAQGVPCGPVRITEELYEDPHVRAQDLIPELDHPLVGPIRVAGSPIHMSKAETGAKVASPTLGQHTREVLTELGYSDGEIAALLESKVARAP